MTLVSCRVILIMSFLLLLCAVSLRLFPHIGLACDLSAALCVHSLSILSSIRNLAPFLLCFVSLLTFSPSASLSVSLSLSLSASLPLSLFCLTHN